MGDDWAVIVPDPDKIRETAVMLLALARDPSDVATQRGGAEFRIPPYLADLYNTPAPALRRRRTKKEGDE